MNEYRKGTMETEVVVRNLWTEICGRKLWTVDGNESILTTPPRFGSTKVQINFRFHCNKQLQRMNNVCML